MPKTISKKLKRQNYSIIKKATSFLTESLLQRYKAEKFPAVIEGTLVYSQKYRNRPLVKACVLLTFQKTGKGDLTSESAISDVNGHFIISTPSAALEYEKMIVDVSRNDIMEKFIFSRGEVVLQEGKLGNLTVKDNFYIEGIFEKVDSLVENISDVVSDYIVPSELASANPKVTLGEGENIFSLTWANAPSCGYSYKILYRLVEPEVSPPAVLSKDPSQNKQRSEIGCPIDVVKFKKKLIESPHNQPRMSSLGMGYVLLMNQEWKPSHFSLGKLLYSLPLAPGEEQRIAISERTETLAVTDSESSSFFQSNRYSSMQRDDITALFTAGLEDTVKGGSGTAGFNLGASLGSGTSAAGGGSYGLFSILGGASALFGIGGSASAAASGFYQKHEQDYTSNLTQNFHQNIQRSAENHSQANRIGVRLATSAESEMVTTKIIANNNHSHALTMQFWEVVQNYKITSKISGVQLVLYIPLEIVQFLPTGVSHILTPGELYSMTQDESGKERFMRRYDMLIKHHDSIAQYLPYQYRQGLNLLKKFASYPRWEFQSGESEGGFTLQFRIRGSFMPYDNLTAVLRLKNGGHINSKSIEYETHQIEQGYHYSQQVLEDIRQKRLNPVGTAKGSFDIPPGVIDDDFASLELCYGSTSFNYTLTPFIPKYISDLFPGKSIEELPNIVSMFFPMLYQQEAFKTPVVRLSQSQLRTLGPLRITEVELSRDSGGTPYISSRRDEVLTSRASYAIFDQVRTMTFEQLQEIERTFQHVVENTMFYSQTVWASLTSSERAIMLEQYTIGIPGLTGEIGEEIPLMNCVQNEVYGFYGNCMLMPFGYPPALAKSLDTSTREVQDALYSYHSMAYRPITTMISMPSRGMVGEAVLGSSNASEKIDLTRFWNWQDSPITHADIIKPSDFSQQHMISDVTAAPDKLAKTENTVNINTSGATLPEDLISNITKIPVSPDLVGMEDLQKFISTLTSSASSERQAVINNASTMTNNAIAGYVNMKAGLGMSGEAKKDQKKTETKEEPKKPTEDPKKPEDPQKPS